MELSLIEMGKTAGGTGLGLNFVHVGCEMPIEIQVTISWTAREVRRQAWAGDAHVETVSMWTVFRVKRLVRVT